MSQVLDILPTLQTTNKDKELINHLFIFISTHAQIIINSACPIPTFLY